MQRLIQPLRRMASLRQTLYRHGPDPIAPWEGAFPWVDSREGPEKVPAGQISVILDVEDQKDHEAYGLAVLTLDEGKTYEDLDAWSSTNQPPWSQLYGLLEEIPQGSRAEMRVTAFERPLFVVCFTAYPITKSDTLGPIEIEPLGSQ
jgi:hypothetical protein